MDLAAETNVEILLNLSYGDIINYCSINKRGKSICDDPYFWTRKLNHDFMITVQGGSLVPSEYVVKYNFVMEKKHTKDGIIY